MILVPSHRVPCDGFEFPRWLGDVKKSPLGRTRDSVTAPGVTRRRFLQGQYRISKVAPSA